MAAPRASGDDTGELRVDSPGPTRIWHYVSAILGGFFAAMVLTVLLSLLSQASLELAPPQGDWALVVVFFAMWAVLSFLMVWRAATARRVIVRALSFIGLEWLAAAALGIVFLYSYPAPNLPGLPPFIALMASPRLFAAIMAMLGLILGGAFLFAAFLVFRE